jgi:hypothetical protein
MRSLLQFLLIGFIFIALSTCAQTSGINGTSVPGNSAPTVSFSALPEVSEAATPGINGDYTVFGTNFDGSTSYSNTNGYFVYKPASSCDFWRIGTDTNTSGEYKIQGIIGTEVPNSKWGKTCSSGASTPYVRLKNTIKGYPYVGQILTAPIYVYHDDEGDSEASSVYAWYICSSTNDAGSAITGANSTNYTLTTNDNGKYIYFSVTPIASSGTTTGIKVKSSYFGPIQTIPSAYVVSGAGNSSYNGIYVHHGFFNGLPSFKNQIGSYYLYFAGCNGYWYLMDSFVSYGTAYRCDTTTNTLYFTNFSWGTKCSGSGSAPTVSITNL